MFARTKILAHTTGKRSHVLVTHDDFIGQRLADGHIVVIGYHHEQTDLSSAKRYSKT